jgi:hypothetical protein
MIIRTEGDEWKMAFRMRYELFETFIMLFGLNNAPESFQEFIHSTLRPFLDIFYRAFLDDILIYCDILKQHKKQGRAVMTALKKAGLYLKTEKCEFHKD